MEHAVNAVFTALIWHTQELREIVAAFGMINSVASMFAL